MNTAILTCTNCGHVWPAPRDARKPPGDCPLCHNQELAAARAVVEAARHLATRPEESGYDRVMALIRAIDAYDKLGGKELT